MRGLLSIAIGLFLACVFFDGIKYLHDKEDALQSPKKTVHVALYDRKGYRKVKKIEVTYESTFVLQKGTLYVKHKSMKSKVGKAQSYRILMIKE